MVDSLLDICMCDTSCRRYSHPPSRACDGWHALTGVLGRKDEERGGGGQGIAGLHVARENGGSLGNVRIRNSPSRTIIR